MVHQSLFSINFGFLNFGFSCQALMRLLTWLMLLPAMSDTFCIPCPIASVFREVFVQMVRGRIHCRGKWRFNNLPAFLGLIPRKLENMTADFEQVLSNHFTCGFHG